MNSILSGQGPAHFVRVEEAAIGDARIQVEVLGDADDAEEGVGLDSEAYEIDTEMQHE